MTRDAFSTVVEFCDGDVGGVYFDAVEERRDKIDAAIDDLSDALHDYRIAIQDSRDERWHAAYRAGEDALKRLRSILVDLERLPERGE